MPIKILYFGHLKDRLGRSGDELTLHEPLTVAEVFCQALRDDPLSKSWQETVLYAVNQERVTRDFVVHDGDEVAFMPPMAGG